MADITAGLLKFLQSPEAMALGQGLLAGSQPSMTQPSSFGGALAQGLGNMQQVSDRNREHQRSEDWLRLQQEIASRKRDKTASSVPKTTSPRNKGISKENRILAAKFIKAYPQYANESMEDIVAVAQKLFGDADK